MITKKKRKAAKPKPQPRRKMTDAQANRLANAIMRQEMARVLGGQVRTWAEAAPAAPAARDPVLPKELRGVAASLRAARRAKSPASLSLHLLDAVEALRELVAVLLYRRKP